MNFQEIIAELQKQEISLSSFAYQDFTNPLLNIGECKEVEQHGGEGKGDSWWSVKYLPDHNMYIKVSGYYASYDGTSFDDWESSVKQVKPQEKTITVYE